MFRVKTISSELLTCTRSDAHRAAEQKRRKDKDIELLAFNSEADVDDADVQVKHFRGNLIQ